MSINTYNSSATEILPGLWLGDIKAALDTGFLKEKNIECVINCTRQHPFSSDSSIKLKYRIPVKDNLEITEMGKLYKSLDQISDKIKSSLILCNVLVHCYAGKQRSAAVIIGYLMKYGLMDLDSAINAVKSKKPDILQPSFNFEPALKLYERNLLYDDFNQERGVHDTY